MSFEQPFLLLTLLVIPLAWLGQLLAQRRRMRYAVRFTNVDVLASLTGSASRLRFAPPALLALALAALGVAVARPHVTTELGSDKAAVILVLDISGSMSAEDVKPTRLVAAQRAVHTFLGKVPGRVRVGLVLFAGKPFVATPPTTDHDLIRQAVDSTGDFKTFGGTAIGDALALAVELGQQIAGTLDGQQVALGVRSLAAHTDGAPPHPLVSILFLSDGHQNRGVLAPLQGAQRAKEAGFPVYTVALGTKGKRVPHGSFSGGSVHGPGMLGTVNGLAPDPVTLRRIAKTTGGKFFAAQTAGAVRVTYARLGSKLGRVRGRQEITDEFVAGAAALLLLAGLASALWAPRLP